jgi:hypothetical protein
MKTTKTRSPKTSIMKCAGCGGPTKIKKINGISNWYCEKEQSICMPIPIFSVKKVEYYNSLMRNCDSSNQIHTHIIFKNGGMCMASGRTWGKIKK